MDRKDNLDAAEEMTLRELPSALGKSLHRNAHHWRAEYIPAASQTLCCERGNAIHADVGSRGQSILDAGHIADEGLDSPRMCIDKVASRGSGVCLSRTKLCSQ